jgi:hypothetical protein
MEIENLFNLETKILDNRVVFKFVYTEKPITELRMLKTIDLLKKVLDSFYKEEVKNVCLIFVIETIKMPTNMKLIKDFATTFHKYAQVIDEKLDFTIIQSNNNIFKLFFSLLKLYYEPIKPLYMSINNDTTQKCLMNDSERKKIANFSELEKI